MVLELSSIYMLANPTNFVNSMSGDNPKTVDPRGVAPRRFWTTTPDLELLRAHGKCMVSRFPGLYKLNFDGLIDDVRIYNYARSVDEIRQDYNAGLGTHFR